MTDALRARARAWLEVDCDALGSNYRLVKSLCAPDVSLFVVLKANAYGLGLPFMAKFYRALGETRFAVACVSEALQVRQAVPDAFVLVMGATDKAQMEDAVRAGICLTVACARDALSLSEVAVSLKTQGYAHIKIDTGLHRLGFPPEEAEDAVLQTILLPGVRVLGLYSHLALRDKAHDEAQHQALTDVLDALSTRGVQLSCVHLCDSIGLVRYPQWQLNAVRVGAFLYGNTPRGFERPERVRAVCAFLTRVVDLRTIPAGECVGYDDAHPVARDTVVATLSVGYADGYPRCLSGVGEVSVRGARARVLGLICMDQTMVDVTDIPNVERGDIATLLGGDIALPEYASWGHLNKNECTAVIGRRVPRVYMKNGDIVDIADEML